MPSEEEFGEETSVRRDPGKLRAPTSEILGELQAGAGVYSKVRRKTT
jgi:hypothetical protein